MVSSLLVVLAQVSSVPCAVSMLADATQQPPGIVIASPKRALLAVPARFEVRCAGDQVSVSARSGGVGFALRFDAASDRLELLPGQPEPTSGDAAHVAWQRVRQALVALDVTRTALGKGVYVAGSPPDALARLQRDYEQARLAAVPFHLARPQRLGLVPKKQSLDDAWWSGATPCVRQGSGGAKVRCFDVARSAWSKPVPAAERPRDAASPKFVFESARLFLAADLAAPGIGSPGVSWTLAELGVDLKTWSSTLIDARRAKAQATKDELARLDCAGRASRLWLSTHDAADEQACVDLEGVTVAELEPSAVWFNVAGDAAVVVFEFDDAWELFVVSAR
ncbi:MAG: hypothetical protein U0228_30740 [Myxococcaceae bacterium]